MNKKEDENMLLKGLQKVTLLDYPERIACTVFTGGCNFRCPFCQNASLVTHIDDDFIPEEEFFQYLESRKGKIDAVCVSGGEPCVQKDLKEFITKIKKMGYLVKLDTNGSYPDTVKELLNNHLLDYIAMDVKNTKEKYALTCGKDGFIDDINESIELIKNSEIPHEFRTTVVKEFHTIDDIVEIAKWVYPSKLYLQQFKDSGDLIQKNLHAHPEKILHEMQEKCLTKNVYLRGIN